MVARLFALIRYDITLQWRNGLYFAYAFVLIFYISILVFLGEYLPEWVSGLIIYTDPVVLGFFFLGALMMLEKSEGTRTALAITPMRASDYFWAKSLSLGAMSIFAIIILGGFLHANINWFLFLLAAILISLTFTSLSFPIALYFKTPTSYLMGAAAILTPLILPMLFALLDPMPFWALIFPPAAQLRLLLVALGTFQASGLELGALLIITILTTLLSVYFGQKSLKQEFGQK